LEAVAMKVANLSESKIAAMIALRNDNQCSHSLWVDHEGEVHLDPFTRDFSIHNPAIKFRLETFNQGNGYVGFAASQDPAWVKRLFVALKENWEEGETGYVDVF
jgi:hypothetical protein